MTVAKFARKTNSSVLEASIAEDIGIRKCSAFKNLIVTTTMQGTSYIDVRKTGYIRKNSYTYVSYIGQRST